MLVNDLKHIFNISVLQLSDTYADANISVINLSESIDIIYGNKVISI